MWWLRHKEKILFIILMVLCIVSFRLHLKGSLGDIFVSKNEEEISEKSDGDFESEDKPDSFSEFGKELEIEALEEEGQDEENLDEETLDGKEHIEDVAKTYTEADMVDFDPENAYSYCDKMVCTLDGKSVKIRLDFAGGIPKSDDDKVYFFEAAVYESDEMVKGKRPVAVSDKDFRVMSTVKYQDRYLFSRFVPMILYDGEYVPVYNGQYIMNPEILSTNSIPYLNIESKKGLLLDAATLGTDKLEDLNVRRAVFNIPLSYIMGETEDEACPTIEYEYDGEIYRFNGYKVMLFDTLFGYLTANGYHSTAIVLNDWNNDFPEMMHPLSRRKTGSSLYYAFNTEEEKGVKMIEACALFLAQRYASGDNGMVYDWVIANEINQQKMWNYMATDNVEYYTESFEKGFRIFYNAIRSVYGSAKVYYSVDHDWNDNFGFNGAFFNARDVVYAFNECAKKGGNYAWNLSIHPYPAPLTRVRFWRGDFYKDEDARRVTPMNMSVVTDMMQKEEFLNQYGKVRDIAVTELGFTSRAGEDLQAAAFAYCYYIIKDNEYISSFLLNRQTDDSQALKSGLSLGIYNNDYSQKELYDVFKNIDTPVGEEYIPRMLEIIGEDSLEEALEKAR